MHVVVVTIRGDCCFVVFQISVLRGCSASVEPGKAYPPQGYFLHPGFQDAFSSSPVVISCSKRNILIPDKILRQGINSAASSLRSLAAFSALVVQAHVPVATLAAHCVAFSCALRAPAHSLLPAQVPDHFRRRPRCLLPLISGRSFLTSQRVHRFGSSLFLGRTQCDSLGFITD